MRRFAAMLPLALLAIGPALAQSGGNPSSAISAQQESLQNLLNSAIVAIQNNDEAGACQLRSQAFTILNNNYNAFVAAYPTNNWSDLQTSLQGSLNRCATKGF